MNATPTCTHCGEPCTAGQPHDSARCWTIAHAYAACNCRNAMMTGEPSEADKHIVELARWLHDHPSPSTPQGRQARKDRLISLNRWISVVRALQAEATPR